MGANQSVHPISRGPQSTGRTRIVSKVLYGSNYTKANRMFVERGKDGKEACIVVQPVAALCCPYEFAICWFSPFISVPSGPVVLYQNWGRNAGTLSPGCKPCWPGWRRISHLVSLQLVTYNHAPKKCPTRDHVFVDLDLSVTLKVNKEQVSKFVFEMGAERLDAYLSFQVEESIRGLVYDVTHDRVNDMRGEFAEDMLAVLQTKVERFGVDIKAVKITNVALPNILQERLENTTSFKTRLTMQSKNHEHTIQTIVEASAGIKCAALLRRRAGVTVRPIHWWICAHRKTHMPNKGKILHRPSIYRSGV